MIMTYLPPPDDPTWDSKEIRRELTPILHQLQVGLRDLEAYINKADDDTDDSEDGGRRGD
jgi:hypothetical protein